MSRLTSDAFLNTNVPCLGISRTLHPKVPNVSPRTSSQKVVNVFLHKFCCFCLSQLFKHNYMNLNIGII